MRTYKMVAANGRDIPKEDKIFGISNRAKAMIEEQGRENVVNGTIGALISDDGELMVLSSVTEAFGRLKPSEYAAYAPIGGKDGFKKAIIKAALGNYASKLNCFMEAVATPGGTGAIRNAISNYSCYGDKILTTDWYWAPYKTIAEEQNRLLTTFESFVTSKDSNNMEFSVENLLMAVKNLFEEQDRLVLILNTPAHNPTGYSITVEQWRDIMEGLSALLDEKRFANKKLALLVDVAYIDFAGDEDEYRHFLPELLKAPDRLITIIGYSLSKTMTLYGMRCGAAICLAKTKEIAEEFRQAFEFSSRAAWSNSPIAAQSMVETIYSDEKLLQRVTLERDEARQMLIRRGKAFEKRAKEIGLKMVPFDAGFFISIPCENPDEVCRKLEQSGIFLVPLAKGIRVSVASISEERCRVIPDIILDKLSK